MTKYRNYTDKDIIWAVDNSESIADVCRLLNLAPYGGNYGTIKRHIKRLDLPTNHFTGQGWNKDLIFDGKSKPAVRKYLIQERGHKCEQCLLEVWNNKPIPLEMDHINGNSGDNRKENLKLLCCNCHAQTRTWRNRKRDPTHYLD